MFNQRSVTLVDQARGQRDSGIPSLLGGHAGMNMGGVFYGDSDSHHVEINQDLLQSRGRGLMNLISRPESRTVTRSDATMICRSLSNYTQDPKTKEARVHVSRLTSDMDRPYIYMQFIQFGEILAISNPVKRSDQFYAFIQYASPECADKACMFSANKRFNGRVLSVTKSSDSGSSSSSNQSAANTRPKVSIPTKRTNSTTSNQNGAPKKRKMSPDRETRRKGRAIAASDILVCGTCQHMFRSMELMIEHKKRPCEPAVKCSCTDESVPSILTCAVCDKGFNSPWDLISHIYALHQILICKELTSDNTAQNSSNSDSPPIKQEPNDNDAEGQETIDLDRDLMQE